MIPQSPNLGKIKTSPLRKDEHRIGLAGATSRERLLERFDWTITPEWRNASLLKNSRFGSKIKALGEVPELVEWGRLLSGYRGYKPRSQVRILSSPLCSQPESRLGIFHFIGIYLYPAETNPKSTIRVAWGKHFARGKRGKWDRRFVHNVPTTCHGEERSDEAIPESGPQTADRRRQGQILHASLHHPHASLVAGGASAPLVASVAGRTGGECATPKMACIALLGQVVPFQASAIGSTP